MLLLAAINFNFFFSSSQGQLCKVAAKNSLVSVGQNIFFRIPVLCQLRG